MAAVGAIYTVNMVDDVIDVLGVIGEEQGVEEESDDAGPGLQALYQGDIQVSVRAISAWGGRVKT